MSTLNKTNGNNAVEITSNGVAELIAYGKMLRKARLRVWDIMFSGIVSSQLPECRSELEQGAQSLTNAIALIESIAKTVPADNKIKKGETK